LLDTPPLSLEFRRAMLPLSIIGVYVHFHAAIILIIIRHLTPRHAMLPPAPMPRLIATSHAYFRCHYCHALMPAAERATIFRCRH